MAIAGTRWRVLGLRIGAVAAIGAIVLIALSDLRAQGATCTNSWLGGSGAWENSGNWSANHPPTEDESACIEVDGTYVVALDTATTVGSLTIGTTTTTGTQTLLIGNAENGASVRAEAGVTVGTRGEIFLDSRVHSSSVFVDPPATLLNAGLIHGQSEPGREVALFGDLLNTGTIRSTGATGLYRSGPGEQVLRNEGLIEVADGAELYTRRDTTFTNAAAGHIATEGSGRVVSGREIGSTFNEAGTTSGPAPVRIEGGTLNYIGDGASEIEATSQFNLGGTLGSDQTLHIVNGAGNAADGFVNDGGSLTIASHTQSSSLRADGPGFENAGTLTTLGSPGHVVALFGPLTNTGTVEVGHSINYHPTTAGNNFENLGQVEIADGMVLRTERDATFTHAASGHIAALGNGHLLSGSAIGNVFNQAGTTEGSRPVRVVGGTLNYVGDGISELEASGQFVLTGTMHAGQQLTITEGQARAESGFTNDGGELTFESFGTSTSMFLGDATLANDGQMSTVGGDGGTEVQIFGNITNTGRFDVEKATGLFGSFAPDVFDNQGTLVIADGETFDFKGASVSFTQSSGRTTLAGPGSRLQTHPSTTFDLAGGILEGTGTVVGTVVNGAEVRPGTSPGTLDVEGTYTQTPLGVLVAEVTATDNDLLDATGAVTLDGTLEVETAAGFEPPLGTGFKVVEGSSRSGQFSDTNGIGSGPYEVEYNPADVTLRVVDPSDLPALSIADAAVLEGDAGTVDAQLTVTLSEPAAGPVDVDFQTANGTARAPEDYSATEGNVRFAAGETEQTATVPVNGDGAPEADETFVVNLRGADGAQVADGRGEVTILNDELDATFATPNRGGDACCVTVAVHGAGFVDGAALRLSRAGEPDIVASEVRVAEDGRSVAGVLDLTGRTRAPWDVEVENPAGRGSETLAGAFVIEAVRRAEPWLRIDGGEVARPNLPYTAMLAFGNTGNVDVTGTVIRLDGVPSFDPVANPVLNPVGLVSEGIADGRGVRFFVPRLAPGTSYVPTQPSFRQATGTVTLRGKIFGGQFDPDQVPPIDPATAVTTEVAEIGDPSSSPARFAGTLHVTGPSAGEIEFEHLLGAASVHADASIEHSEPGPGVDRFRFTGTTEIGGQIRSFDTTLEGPASAFDGLGQVGAFPDADNASFALGARRGPAGERKPPPLVDPLGFANAHAAKSAAVTRRALVDCLVDPPDGKPPVNLTPIIRQQLEDYVRGGETAGTLGLIPVPGAAGGAWQAAVEAEGFVLGESFEKILGRELGNAALNDPRFPRWDEMQNFSDRIASAIVWCAPPPPPDDPPTGGGTSVTKTIRVTNSRDPNAKAGPDGFGAARFVESTEPVPYMIQFENVATATAAAQVVEITDQLDPARLDLATVSLGPVQFGDVFAGPPPGLKHWTTDLDLRPEQDLVVRVEADLDEVTGLLRWRFSSLDPETLEPTTDPLAGFLPPNVNPPEGEGSVLFTASPVAGLDGGDEIRNSASIVFDTNAPIVTNTWLNTIDDDPPDSRAAAGIGGGGGAGCATAIAVNWSGTDTGSGIAAYDVYASVDGKPYFLWRNETTDTAGTYPGEPGHTYRFYTVARDGAGHAEAAPAAADAEVTVDCADPPAPEPPAAGDSTPPQTTIKKLIGKTRDRTPTFRFVSSEPGSSFECRVDKKRFAACDSPHTTRKLKRGKHRFEVRSIDTSGNIDPSPAKDKFKLKRKRKKRGR